MSNYDSNGRLKIIISSPTASSSPTGSNIYITGSLVASGITSLNFSSSFLIPSASNINNVVTVSYNPKPIYAVSGFKSDATAVDARFYYHPVYSVLTGSVSQNFMIAALFQQQYLGAGFATVVSKYDMLLSDGYYIMSPNGDYADDYIRVGHGTGGGTLERSLPFGTSGKWILAVASYDNLGSAMYLWVNGRYGGTIATRPDFVDYVPFMIGACGDQNITSASRNADNSLLVSAVAINTASSNINDTDHFLFFRKCFEAGDIVQDSTMNWHHLWSVKQNPPGATWTAAVGNLNLTRTGSLINITQSNPRWF